MTLKMKRIPNVGDYVVFPHPSQSKRSGFVVEIADDMIFVSSSVEKFYDRNGKPDRLIRRTGTPRLGPTFAPQLGYFIAPNPAPISFGWRVEAPGEAQD